MPHRIRRPDDWATGTDQLVSDDSSPLNLDDVDPADLCGFREDAVRRTARGRRLSGFSTRPR
jgi:hypothetical protein